jgi:hypothetical protein
VRKEPPADVEKELSMVASRRALLERGAWAGAAVGGGEQEAHLISP